MSVAAATGVPNAIKTPNGWDVVRLGDVAEVTFSTVDKKTVDGEIPVRLCNYTDVFYNQRVCIDMPFMEATASPTECLRWALREGDVLFTKDSETVDEIGVPSYVSGDMPGVLCGYHLGRARPIRTSLYGAFLARALASQAAAREFSRIANGITRFGLTLGATRALKLVLPPLGEQRAIAAVLDSIDEAIERTDEVIAAIERLRDALLHELLTRGLPGQHAEWKEAPGLGTIPASWKAARLGDVAEVIGGSTPSRTQAEFWGGDIPWVVPSEVTELTERQLRSSRESITAEGLRAAGLRVLPAQSVLLTTRATIGAAAIAALPVTTNQGFQSLVGRRGIDSLWLYYCVSSRRRELMRRGAGSTFREVSRDAVRQLLILLPPLAEQRAIAAVLDSVDASIERAREERAVLSTTATSISDALLTGRVRVEQRGK